MPHKGQLSTRPLCRLDSDHLPTSAISNKLENIGIGTRIRLVRSLDALYILAQHLCECLLRPCMLRFR